MLNRQEVLNIHNKYSSNLNPNNNKIKKSLSNS